MNDFQQAIFLKHSDFSVGLPNLCEARPATEKTEEVLKCYLQLSII